MAERAGLSKPVRFVMRAILVVLLALPTLLGRVSSPLVLLLSLAIVFRPGLLARLRAGPANRADGLFVASFILMAVALLASADAPEDLAYILNFAPFLLVPPLRRAFGQLNDPDPAHRVGQLALAGAGASLAVALVQVLVLRLDRVGQPIMNTFQFADTAMLLGFMALAGWFAPGPHRRWIFLLGPVAGTIAVLLSGTRGALLALPILLVTVFGFVLMQSPKRRQIASWGLGVLLVCALLFLLAPQLGFERATGAFRTLGHLMQGGTFDQSTRERLMLYSGGLAAFWQSPVVGYGWGDMVKAIYPHIPADMLETAKTFRQLHNGLLCFGVGAGLFGLVAFVLVSAAPVVGLFGMRPDDSRVARSYVALVLVASFQVFQLTYILLGFDFHTIQFAVVTALVLGYMRDPEAPAAVAAPQENVSNHDRPRRYRRNRKG